MPADLNQMFFSDWKGEEGILDWIGAHFFKRWVGEATIYVHLNWENYR